MARQIAIMDAPVVEFAGYPQLNRVACLVFRERGLMESGGGVASALSEPGLRLSSARSAHNAADALAAFARRVLELSLLGIVTLLPLAFSPGVQEIFVIPKVTLLRLLSLLAVAAWISLSALGGRWRVPGWKVSLSVIAYLLIMCLATVFSVTPSYSLFGNHVRSDGLLTIFSYLTVFILAATVAERRYWVRRLLVASVGAGGVVSALGIAQFVGAAPLGIDPAGFNFSPFATVGNPDFLGAYLTILFPLAAGLFFTAGSLRARAFFAGLGLLIGVCIIFTLARASWLAFLFSGMTLVVLLRRDVWQRKVWLALVAAVFLAALLAVEFGWSISTRQLLNTSGGASPSGETALARVKDALEARGGAGSRISYWQGALEVIVDRPWLGGGPNSFSQTFGKFASAQYSRAEGLDRFPDKVHNEFLEAGVAAGIPGFIAYLAMLLGIGLVCWRRWHAIRGNGRYLGIALFSTWIAFLINTAFIFPSIDTAATFWLLMGLAVGHGASSESGEMLEGSFSIGSVGLVLVHLTLAVMLVAGVQATLRPYLADVAFKNAHEMPDGSAEQLANAREAIRLNPEDTYYYSQYAWLLSWKGLQTVEPAERRSLLDDSLIALGEAIRRDPRNHQLYFQRAQIYEGYDDHALDAIADLQTATALYPNYYHAYVALSHLARQSGNLDVAIAAENRMLRIFPHDDTAFQGLGFDLFAAGRYGEARDVLLKNLKFDPNNAELYDRLARSYEAAGDLQNAASAYNEALTLDPDNSDARSGLESLQWRMAGSHQY